MTKLTLIIEKGDTDIWGRVKYKDHLMIDVAKTEKTLVKRIRQLIAESHPELKDYELEIKARKKVK